MKARYPLIAAALALAVTSAHAGAPGAKPGADVPSIAPQTQPRIQPESETAKCTFKGAWTNTFGGTFAIKKKKVGKYTASYCASKWKVVVTSSSRKGFDIAATYTGTDGCQDFTESQSYKGCTATTGTFANADGSGGTDDWTLNPVASSAHAPSALLSGLR